MREEVRRPTGASLASNKELRNDELSKDKMDAMPEPALLWAGRTVDSRAARRRATARRPGSDPTPRRLGGRVQVLRLGDPGGQPTLQYFSPPFVLEGHLAALSRGLLSSWT